MLLKLELCDPGLWRCQLKTCRCCYCCWCWWWGTYWQKFGRDFYAEDGSRYRFWGLVKILKLKFVQQFFETDVWLRLWIWSSVDILKLNLVNILKFMFCQDFEAVVCSIFWCWCLVEILKLKLDKDLCKNLWYDLRKLLVSRTQPSGPLCHWQCLGYAGLT